MPPAQLDPALDLANNNVYVFVKPNGAALEVIVPKKITPKQDGGDIVVTINVHNPDHARFKWDEQTKENTGKKKQFLNSTFRRWVQEYVDIIHEKFSGAEYGVYVGQKSVSLKSSQPDPIKTDVHDVVYKDEVYIGANTGLTLGDKNEIVNELNEMFGKLEKTSNPLVKSFEAGKRAR